MKTESRPTPKATYRASQPSDRLVAEAAWLYFVRGKTQGEIAKRLSISRPTVISYLKLAKERKLVNIRVDAKHYRMNEVSERLKETYELLSVHVVPNNPDDHTDIEHTVCEVAAHFLPTWLEPDDTLGVSWGATVSQIAKLVPSWPIEGLTVSQFIGSMAEPLHATAECSCKTIARQLSGYCINLNAPAVCSSVELADALKDEPTISAQLKTLSRCNKALFSLGPCTTKTQSVSFKVATQNDIDDYTSKGAVGIINGRFIDAQGQPVIGELDRRLISANHDLLKATEGLLVVTGLDNLAATLAALRGNYVDRLVLDIDLAEAILEAA